MFVILQANKIKLYKYHKKPGRLLMYLKITNKKFNKNKDKDNQKYGMMKKYKFGNNKGS